MPRRVILFRSGLRHIPIILSGVMLVSCATAVDPNASPAQQRIAQANQHFNGTVAEAAVFGAVLGGVGGYLLGGAKGAAIGAGAGLAAGGLTGYLVAQNNFQHAQTQQNLNAAIQDSMQAAQEARTDAADSEQVAAEARAQAAGLAQALHAGRITADQYRSQLAGYNQSLKDLQQVSHALAAKSEAIRKNVVLAGGNGSQLADSANDIDRSRNQVDQAAEQICQALAATPSA